ncbi:MAG: MATE family efflux transporter, partial [Oscillospiraceae bacterium]|nr:MATE family efflux transporter [Oscillospiraceae bacterium]
MTKYVTLPPDRDSTFLGIFTKNREFYKTFFRLLIIISLQQLAALAVNMVDNIMLGRYTELALSGATLVNQIQFTLQQVSAGVGLGIVVLASQYWGQRRIEPIKKIIGVGMKVGLLIGLVFFLLSYFYPHFVLSLFTNDETVIAEGLKYLRIICWTYLIFAISNSLMYSLQGVETAGVGTVMSISTIIINLCLNYCFIYGNFGAPEMGIRGAALATLISRSVELLIILIYIFVFDKKLKIELLDLISLDFTYFGDYIKVAAPVVISGALWGIAQAAQTAVLGHISASVIAANSIAVIIFQIFAVVGMSCANVASVVMGKTVGEGKLSLVRSYSKTMQAIFIILGVTSAILLFSFKDVIIGFYSVSEETKKLAIQFICVLSVSTIGTCYEYPVESGIIAGGGHTKYQAYADNLFMWLWT